MGSDRGLGMPPLPNVLRSLRSRCDRGELRSSARGVPPLPPVASVVELHATGVPPPRPPLSRDEGLRSPRADEFTRPLVVVELARHAGELIVMFSPERGENSAG